MLERRVGISSGRWKGEGEGEGAVADLVSSAWSSPGRAGAPRELRRRTQRRGAPQPMNAMPCDKNGWPESDGLRAAETNLKIKRGSQPMSQAS